ncbi:TIGR03862 family flavoprotein [Microvirga sp. W0021]|uniref:TIGR03862 family flavoprotein n=1 Tax=Hohaiivirga grylli TaxID=3133970 RepID=A0ABV0BH86_9HYPH
MSSAPLIAIIGAGPAGLAAAEILATSGYRVTIYERMPSPARKFLMAGRGGLNLTHSEPLDTFLTRYGENAGLICEAVKNYPPTALRAWADELGQQTFIGSSGRVFPASIKASPLLRAWLSRLEATGVKLVSRHTWTGWNDSQELTFKTEEGDVFFKADATLLALGGASWPRLGSDGNWVEILQHKGINICPLQPANVGLHTNWSEIFRTRFAGEPLKRIAIHFKDSTVQGEAMVTSSGIEGGAIYAIGKNIRDTILEDGQATIHIDLKPDIPLEVLTTRLGKKPKGQSTSNFLRKAAGLSPIAINLLREVHQTSLPESPGELAQCIKNLPIILTGVAPIHRAISTAGGVDLAEVSQQFMLNKQPGIFVAGEMLDWEAPTGGYLLQACFASGIAAANGIKSWLEGQS